jgi:hypothetical protein
MFFSGFKLQPEKITTGKKTYSRPAVSWKLEKIDIGSYTSPGVLSICPGCHVFFLLAKHITFWQWTLAARQDCNFNIFCAAPSGHTVGMPHYGLF